MEKRVGLFAVITFALVYHLLFFRHAMPVQEGWFQLFGENILKGQMPYKDFYSHFQPVYLYIHAFLVGAFGDGFMVGRIYGIFERILLLSSAYLLLTRFFEPKYVFTALVTSLMVYSGAATDGIMSYNQLCLTFALFSCFFASFYIVDLFSRASLRLLFLGGIFGGLSFLTKQTTGLFVPLAIFVVIFLQGVKTRRLAGIMVYAFGSLFPSALFMLFLNRHGALGDYFSQVFTAASGGGSVFSLSSGFLTSTMVPGYIIPFFVIALLLAAVCIAFEKALPMRNEPDGSLGRYEMLAVLSSFCLVILFLHASVDFWSWFYSASHVRGWFDGIRQQIVIYSFFFIMCYFLYYIGRVLFVYEYDRLVVFKALVSALGLAVMYFSQGVGALAVIPSMTVMLVFLFSADYPFVIIKNKILYLFCFLIILFSAAQRFQ